MNDPALESGVERPVCGAGTVPLSGGRGGITKEDAAEWSATTVFRPSTKCSAGGGRGSGAAIAKSLEGEGAAGSATSGFYHVSLLRDGCEKCLLFPGSDGVVARFPVLSVCLNQISLVVGVVAHSRHASLQFLFVAINNGSATGIPRIFRAS